MSAIFPSLFDEILFWVVIPGGLVFDVAVVKKARPANEPDKKRDTHEPAFLGPLSGLFLLPIPIIIGYARIGVLPSSLFYPGLIFWLVGGAIYGWGVLTLGRFYSRVVRIIPGHQVIQKGPYRFVRHPMYAGEILAFMGLGMALQSWVALLIILAAAGISFGYRIPVEERFLAAELGDEYVQYMKRVKRLIPYLV